MNTVCHIEIQTRDLARSQAFYQAVFPNWSFRSFGEDMVVFGEGESHIGGLMKSDQVEPGQSPSVWIHAEAIEPILERVTQAGGSISAPKFAVPGVGWSAVFLDPEGSPLGLVEFGESSG